MSAPGEAAVSSYLQVSKQSTLTASDAAGNSYVLQLSTVPNAGTTTFNGHSGVLSSADRLSVTRNGVLTVNNIYTSYYTLNPYTAFGTVYAEGAPYVAASNSVALPTTITIGDSGPLDDLTFYHDSSMTAVEATAAQTYVVSANNATTLLLCINTVTSGVKAAGTADGLTDGTESDCYTVDAAGTATLVSVTLSVLGEVLTFK